MERAPGARKRQLDKTLYMEIERSIVRRETRTTPTEAVPSPRTSQTHLPSLQVKLVEAESSHTFELRSGSELDFQQAMARVCSQRTVAKKIEEILKRYGVTNMPTTKDDNISALFKTSKAA